MFGCWENRVKLIYTEKLLCSSRCFCFEKLYKFLLFFALLACFEELCSLFNTTYTCIYIWTLTHSHLYIYKYMYIITLWRLEIFFLSLLILLQIFSTSRKPNVSSDYVFVISSLITQEINDFFPKKEISLFWFLISNFWFSILDVFFFDLFDSVISPIWKKIKERRWWCGPMSTTATNGNLFRYRYSESEASTKRGPHQVCPPMVWTAQITRLFFA